MFNAHPVAVSNVKIFIGITKQFLGYLEIPLRVRYISTECDITSTVKMQFEDLDCEGSTKCNCQLLQTVQNLVDKYRNVIGAESSSQIDDRYDCLSSHHSTVCGLADSSTMLKALPLSEYALSEVSSQLSASVQMCHRQSHGGSTTHLACSSSGIRAECPSVKEHSREEVDHSAGELVYSPLRIVRIPNRMCPVHCQIDEHYFNDTGSALELSYETISVTNCWQGLKLMSPSNNASTNSLCSSVKIGLSTSSINNSLPWYNSARILFCKFLRPFWSFISWALIVVICGSIVFFFHANLND